MTIATTLRRLAGVGGVGLLGLLLMIGPAQAQTPPPLQAGLVIVGAEDDVFTACVDLEGEALTGLELLQAVDVDHVLSTDGGAVCALGGVGCSTDDCFCECQGAPCRYWSYFHLDADGTWAYSGVGASSWILRPGDVDAWVWGDGSPQPPPLRFEDLCGAAPEMTVETRSTLPAEARSTPIATPASESTPQTQIFIPGVGTDQRSPAAQESLWSRALTWLDEGYRGFFLLLLLLAALALIRKERKDETQS
ncbi:MAG: hypothetical protein ACP5HG_12500 [Anaerolineae bacterium]